MNERSGPADHSCYYNLLALHVITNLSLSIVSDDVMASVRVAVRVRPFNGREKQMSSSLVVKMTGEEWKVCSQL